MDYRIEPSGLSHALSLNGTGGEVVLRAVNIRSERTGIHAEVSIAYKDVRLAYDTFNVGRQADRHKLAATAWDFMADEAQKALVEKRKLAYNMDDFCYGLWDAWSDREREADIEVSQEDYMDIKAPEWLAYPLLLKDQPNIFFGHESSAKSLLALTLAASVLLPWKNNPLVVSVGETPVKTLYLDWERNPGIFKYNLMRLAAGHNLGVLNVYYRRVVGPLWRNIESIKRSIKRTGCLLIIMDSLSLACAGNMKDTESPTQFFESERELGVTSCILGHTSKSDEEAVKSTYGAYTFQAQAGNVWELAKHQGERDEHMFVGMFHRKQPPFSGLHKPLAVRVDFQRKPASLCITPANIEDIPEFSGKLSLKARVLKALGEGPMSRGELCSAATCSRDVLRVTLSRLKSEGLVNEAGKEVCLAET